jgi:class 3 adenylate cyclase/tetratricopeptide (TPR) repeat protein
VAVTNPATGARALERLRVVPYLPRLVVEWMNEDPGQTFRELQGSAMFVDLSGFTTLSERLGRKGKAGAEELADAIGERFASLLAIAYDNGGGLLKFGGDALFVMFDGPGHEERACQSAVAMNRELHASGRIEVGGELARLSMSASVHSGAFHGFLVGDTHRELIVTGPATTTLVALEGAAHPGEILISDETARALTAPVLGGRRPLGVVLLDNAGLSDHPAPDHVVAESDAVLSCVPRALRSLLLAGALEPEHRRVTISFLHFDGVDEELERGDVEHVTELLEEVVGVVQRAAERYHVTFLGSDIDANGGKLILATGAPTHSRDDEGRMLRALHEIVTQSPGIGLRIGVHRGQVFAGDIGPAYRRTYTVMGDAVNLTARLMAKAKPGEILASASVLESARTPFETEPLEPFLVKGKAEPVVAARVLGPSSSETARTAGADLVGRETELTALLHAAAEARAGTGSLVVVVGDAGMGKTRLVQELRARAADLVQLTMACEVYESSTPFFPFRALLRAVLEISDETARALTDAIRGVAPELEQWTPLLGPVAGIDVPETEATLLLEDRFRSSRLAEVMTALLSSVLVMPTLVVVEDAQWMDEASAELLARIASDLQTRPWLVCVTRRREEGGFAPQPDGMTTLDLDSLGEAETRRLFENVAATNVNVNELAAMVERSGGNPLFVKELADAASSGSLGEILPDSIETLIAARIDRLPPRDRAVLRQASVLGQSFTLTLLEAVVDDPEGSEDSVRRLDDFVVVEGPSKFAFEHALVRDAAYEGLPYRSRRRLHARAADFLVETSEDATAHTELLSFHYFYAERHSEAWHYSRLAGTRAARLFASVDAARLYQRALDSSASVRDLDPHEVRSVREALGDVHERLGNFAEAERTFRVVQRGVKHDPVARARLLLKVARVHGWQGRYPQALASITRGLRLVEAVETEEAARQRCELLAWYARFCHQSGRPSKAVKWSTIAVEASESAGEKSALADALQILDWAYEDLGSFDRATTLPRALSLYEELGDLPGQASVFNSMGAAAHARGDWSTALEHFERTRAIVERTGDAVMHGTCSANVAEIALDEGRLDDAEPLFRDALRTWEAAGIRAGVVFAKRNLGRCATWLGRPAEASELLEEALAEARAAGAHGEVVATRARLAELRYISGETDEALITVDDLLTGIGRDDAEDVTPQLHRLRAVCLLELGDQAEATAAFLRSSEAARARSADYELALTSWTSARSVDDKHRIAQAEALLVALGVVGAPDLLAGAPRLIAIGTSRRPEG